MSKALVATLLIAWFALTVSAAPPRHRHTVALRNGQNKNTGGGVTPQFEPIAIKDPPSGAPLLPECVPKYVLDLIIPPTMPVNSAGLPYEDVGCYDMGPYNCDKHKHDEAGTAAIDDENEEEATISKYKGKHGKNKGHCKPRFTDYQISVKQIDQVVLPVGTPPVDPSCPAFAKTTVFAYGPDGVTPLQHNYPAFTIEAQRFKPNRIVWKNDLVDGSGNYLQHILKPAIDQTLHWANPQKLGGAIDDSPCMGCDNGCPTNDDCRTAATTDYTGPVPIVTHLHGAESVRDFSDGFTEAWFMPNAKDIPTNTSKNGTWYKTFEDEYKKATCTSHGYAPGTATYIYPNAQKPTSLWYHDHTLGLTRLNVYAGMAGFYFIRDFFPTYSPKDTGPELPGLPYPPPGGAVNPADIRELPLAIQDRTFQNNSQWWYPVADVPSSLALPDGAQPPRWIPEFLFGDNPVNYMMMVVNGRTWPKQALAPDTYRLRILNGCNARTLQLGFARTSSSVTDLGNANDNTDGRYTLLPFYVAGNEGGWFPQLQGPVTSLEVGNAERYDVIIDFSTLGPSDFVYMINTGPENPFDGSNNGGTNQFTSQLMRFEFTATSSRTPGAFDAARQAVLNKALEARAAVTPQLPPSNNPPRQVVLMEQDNPLDATFVKAVLLGTPITTPVNGQYYATNQPWGETPPRSTSATDEVEEWDIYNLTPDVHPIHLHEVDFEFVSRTGLTINDTTGLLFPLNKAFSDTGAPVTNDFIDPWLNVNCPTSINPSGKCPALKDTMMVVPGTRTRIRLRTASKPGLFVWHCHIVEHEDNEMMVPWCVGPPSYPDPRNPSRPYCAPVNNVG